MKKSPNPKDKKTIKHAESEQIVEYYPDLLSNYSNSSGTISYETIITPRIPEQKELRLASNVDESSDQCYFLREVDLLPPPLIPEVVEWDLVKRFNRLLQVKERNKKTVEVQRTEKGTIEQSKRRKKSHEGDIDTGQHSTAVPINQFH